MGGQIVAATPFVGEQYLLELFLPEAPGMPNNVRGIKLHRLEEILIQEELREPVELV
jgi:hypothetical protein